jgi:hypothetical protein
MSSSRDKQTRGLMAPLPAMPLPARPSLGERLRRLGAWLVALTLPELVGGVLLVRALVALPATLRADLGIALLAAAALQLVLGLALWRRRAHWWVLLGCLLVGFVGALLR